MKKKWMLLGVCILAAGVSFWFMGEKKETAGEQEKPETEIIVKYSQEKTGKEEKREERKTEEMDREETEQMEAEESQPEETEETEETEEPKEMEELEGQTGLVFQGFYKEAFRAMGISETDAAKQLKEWADKNGYSGEKEIVFGHTMSVDLSEGKYSVDFQLFQGSGGNGVSMPVGDKRFVMDYYPEDGKAYFH